MSVNLNQCNFIGNLGNPPEIKYTASGQAVANISIACGDDYFDKAKNEWVDRTNWVRGVAFGDIAERIGKRCDKGTKVFMSGKQVTRKWQNQQGQDQYTTEINIKSIEVLSGGIEADQGGQQQAPQQSQQPASQDGGFSDDIPFANYEKGLII